MNQPTKQVTLTVTIDFTEPITNVALVLCNVMDGLICHCEDVGIAPDGVGDIAVTQSIIVAAPNTELRALTYNPLAPGNLQA